MEQLRQQAEHSRVPSQQLLYGVATLAILKGNHGDVNVYSDREPIDAGDVSDSGTVVAEAVFDAVPAGSKVLLHKKGSQYIVIQWECQ